MRCIFRIRAVFLGGRAWVFWVKSLNGPEAALRSLPFDILERATRCRSQEKGALRLLTLRKYLSLSCKTDVPTGTFWSGF